MMNRRELMLILLAPGQLAVLRLSRSTRYAAVGEVSDV